MSIFSGPLKVGFRAVMDVLSPKTSLSRMAGQSAEQFFSVLDLEVKHEIFKSKQLTGSLELPLLLQCAPGSQHDTGGQDLTEPGVGTHS